MQEEETNHDREECTRLAARLHFQNFSQDERTKRQAILLPFTRSKKFNGCTAISHAKFLFEYGEVIMNLFREEYAPHPREFQTQFSNIPQMRLGRSSLSEIEDVHYGASTSMHVHFTSLHRRLAQNKSSIDAHINALKARMRRLDVELKEAEEVEEKNRKEMEELDRWEPANSWTYPR